MNLLNNTSSIYPNGKIDMISKEVGEDYCSLKEGVMRNVISLLLEFGNEKPYQLLNAKIHLSKIVNKAKLTYRNVDRLFENSGILKKDRLLKDNLFLIKEIIDNQENFPKVSEKVDQKLQNKLDERYEGYLIGIDIDQLSIYIPAMNRKIFKFKIDVENLDNILDNFWNEDEIGWKRKDNGSVLILKKIYEDSG